ncbi:FG-GAP-like repeat-containing protein [Streptomyces sp. NPDC048603]|uniref:FG-GAP-like repeat-containing protein n=1 Tax=Streptomyces sp. NPDC048603 TaxID=3365577 RepID=UPI00372077BD
MQKTKGNGMRGAAAAGAVVLAATAVPLAMAGGAAASAAMPPSAAEHVIPARKTADPYPAPVATTAEGFLRKASTADTYTWTAYGSDEAKRVGPFPGTVHRAGEHTVAFVQTKASGTTVTFRDMRDGSAKTLTVPAAQAFQAVVGESVLTRTTGESSVHWLTLEDGRLVDRVVHGVPYSWTEVRGYNRHGALLKVSDTFYWVTPDGKVSESAAFEDMRVVGDWLFTTDRSDDTLARWFKVWDAKGSLDPGAAKQVNEPYLHSGGNLVGVVGGDAVQLAADGRLYALPLDGGAPRVLADKATTATAGPGGTVVATALQSDGSHALHAVVPGEDGRAVVRRSTLPEVSQSIARIAMDNGRVHVINRYPLPEAGLSQYVMAPAGAPQAGTWRNRPTSVGKYFPKRCEVPASCPDLLPVGEGQLLADAPGNAFLRIQNNDSTTPHTNIAKAPGTLQGSGQYAAWLAEDRKTVGLFNIYAWTTPAPAPVPVHDGVFALSGSWVWREQSTGALEAVDVRTGSVVRTAKVADCDVTALEAWASSVYWKCDGTKSGVYDTSTRANEPLPAHNSARLGNGFVAWEKGGVLYSTALRGTSGTREIGRPASVRPGEGWAVDRQSGRIGWADAGDAIHVVDAGVPAVGLSSYDRNMPAEAVVNKGGGLGWQANWWLNHPAASWSLTFTRKANGAVVRTINGTEARGEIRAVWNGRDEAGKLAPTGEYVWTLTAKHGDAGVADLKASGTVPLRSATEQPRDLAGNDGLGDLVTLDAKGALTFHGGDGKGGFGGAKVTGTGWPTNSTVIPFGDLNGGRCNDVLVRNSAGTLRSYQPACGTAVTPATGSTWLGTGWNAYDVLTSAGDVTGDGRADLLGRQAATGDLYLFAHDGSGALKPGVKVSGGWKSYRQVLGAGDLNGDGHGDLLAVDSANTLWRFDGTGKGTFKARVQVNGAGWASGRVQFIGVGDVSGDGKADIVSRNAAGELLRNSGDGKGGLQATVKIATGFGGYKGIY